MTPRPVLAFWRSADIADAAAFGGHGSRRPRSSALPDAMIVVQPAVVWGYSRREREFATDKTADVVSLLMAGRSRVLAERSRAR